jgi:hypothetical protein
VVQKSCEKLGAMSRVADRSIVVASKIILAKHSPPAIVPEVISHRWVLSKEGGQRCDWLAGEFVAHRVRRLPVTI